MAEVSTVKKKTFSEQVRLREKRNSCMSIKKGANVDEYEFKKLAVSDYKIVVLFFREYVFGLLCFCCATSKASAAIDDEVNVEGGDIDKSKNQDEAQKEQEDAPLTWAQLGRVWSRGRKKLRQEMRIEVILQKLRYVTDQMNYEKKRKREEDLNYINMINVDTESSSDSTKETHLKQSLDSFGTDNDFDQFEKDQEDATVRNHMVEHVEKVIYPSIKGKKR